MDDLVKILLYVGAAVIYFIFKNKKNFKGNTPSRIPAERAQPAPYKPSNEDDPFEQLLKEVAQKWEEKDVPAKTIYTDNTKMRRAVQPSTQKRAYSSTVDSSLEGQGERQLKGLMSQSGKNEGMSDDDRSLLEKNKESKKFKEYEIQTRANPYQDFAKDPKRLREAFVMGEILQRKY